MTGQDGRDDARRAALFALQRDAVLLLDGHLRVVDDNGRLGRPVADLSELLALVSEPDRDRLRNAVQRGLTAAPGWRALGTVRMRWAGGGWRTVFVEADNRLADPVIGALQLRLLEADPAGQEPPEPGLPHPVEMLDQVVAQAPVALVVCDSQGVVQFAAGATLLLDPATLVGRSLLDLSESPEERARLVQALAGEHSSAVVAWGGRHWQTEYRPLHRGGRPAGVVSVSLDITNQVLAEQARSQGDARLRGVIEAAQEAIIVIDPQGRVSSANAACTRLFGAPLRPGVSLRELLDPTTADLLEGKLARRAAGEAERYELRVLDAAREPVWLLVSSSPMHGDDGSFLGTVAVLTDISLHKATERRLEAAARTDLVTGVANRVTLADRLEHALSRRSAGVVAVLFCDVDDLKAVNDRLGHAAGDELLRHVARQVSSVLRPADSLARFAGDEFVVVCEELPDAEEAMRLGERVREAVQQPFPVAGSTLVPTMSIGVATSPPYQQPDALLAAADAAAYAAKRAGRNAVRAASDPTS